MRLILADARHPLRPTVEAAVRAVYARQYGATDPVLPPRLMAGLDADGAVRCVAGLRPAPFFSEIYLDEPIESLLTSVGGQPVARDRIIEVSALAAPRPGAAMALARAVVALCRRDGFEWAFFTATARLRVLLRRAGVPLVPLAPARADRVNEPRAWGSYYLHDPQVCAVHHAMPTVVPSDAPIRPAAADA